jgi:chromate transporter
MLFQVVAIQPSERWAWEMRNSSMWPLKAEVVHPGWVTTDTFLAGYGAAQAVPGPLFTFAAYLGAVMCLEPNGLLGAAIALVGVFLPGLLLVVGALPFWDVFRKRHEAQAAMRGANAAVVGILGAALYNPVWTSAIVSPNDFVFALVGFVLLTVWAAPPGWSSCSWPAGGPVWPCGRRGGNSLEKLSGSRAANRSSGQR